MSSNKNKNNNAPLSIIDEQALDNQFIQSRLAAVSRQVQQAAHATLSAMEPFTIFDPATGEEKSLDDPEVRRWVMAERPDVYQRWLAALELGQRIERQRRMERVQAKVQERRAEKEAEFEVTEKKIKRSGNRAQQEVDARAQYTKMRREKRLARFEKKQEAVLTERRKKLAKVVAEHNESLAEAKARREHMTAQLAEKMRAHTEMARATAEQTLRLNSAATKERIKKMQDEESDRKRSEKDVEESPQQQSQISAEELRRQFASGMYHSSQQHHHQQQQQQKQRHHHHHHGGGSSTTTAVSASASSAKAVPASAAASLARVFSDSAGDAALAKECQKGYYDERGVWHALTEEQQQFAGNASIRRAAAASASSARNNNHKQFHTGAGDTDQKKPSTATLKRSPSSSHHLQHSPSSFFSSSPSQQQQPPGISAAVASGSPIGQLGVIRALSFRKSKSAKRRVTQERLYANPRRSREELIAQQQAHDAKVGTMAKQRSQLHKSFAMFGTSTTKSLAQLAEHAARNRKKLDAERWGELEQLPKQQREALSKADRQRAEYLERVMEQVKEMRREPHPPDDEEQGENDEEDGEEGDEEEDDEERQEHRHRHHHHQRRRRWYRHGEKNRDYKTAAATVATTMSRGKQKDASNTTHSVPSIINPVALANLALHELPPINDSAPVSSSHHHPASSHHHHHQHQHQKDGGGDPKSNSSNSNELSSNKDKSATSPASSASGGGVNKAAAGAAKPWQNEGGGDFGYKVATLAELREKRERQREKNEQLARQALIAHSEKVHKFATETKGGQEARLALADKNREQYMNSLQKHLVVRRQHREDVHQNAVKTFNDTLRERLEPFERVLRLPSFITFLDVSYELQQQQQHVTGSSSPARYSFSAAGESMNSRNALDADGIALAEIQRQQLALRNSGHNFIHDDDNNEGGGGGGGGGASNNNNNSNKQLPPIRLMPHFAEPVHRVDDMDEARLLYDTEPKKTAPLVPKPSTLPKDQQNKILLRAQRKMEQERLLKQQQQQNANAFSSFFSSTKPGDVVASPTSAAADLNKKKRASCVSGGGASMSNITAATSIHHQRHSSSNNNEDGGIGSERPPKENLLFEYTSTEQYQRARMSVDERRAKTETRLELAQKRTDNFHKSVESFYKQRRREERARQADRERHVGHMYALLDEKAEATAQKLSALSTADERRAEHLQAKAARARVIGTELSALAKTERVVLEQLEEERQQRAATEKAKRAEEQRQAAEAQEAALAVERLLRKNMVLSDDVGAASMVMGGDMSMRQAGSLYASMRSPAAAAPSPPRRKTEAEKRLEEAQRKARMETLLESALQKSKPSASQKEEFLPLVALVDAQTIKKQKQPSSTPSAAVGGSLHKAAIAASSSSPSRVAVAQTAREELAARERRSRALKEQLGSKLQQQEMDVATHLALSFEKSKAAKHHGAPSFTVRPPATARRSAVVDPSAAPRFAVRATDVTKVLFAPQPPQAQS